MIRLHAALLLCAMVSPSQHIEYGSWIRAGIPTLAPAEDSSGNLIVLAANLAFGLGPAPTLPVLLLNRYGRDGSWRLLTDTGLAGRGNNAALLVIDKQDRVYVGVDREAEPLLGRFGPGDARKTIPLFVPFTRLQAIGFAPNGDPIVLGKDSAPGAWTMQLVRLDAETFEPKTSRLITGVPASARALAVDRNGAVYVAGSAFASDLGLGIPTTKIGNAELGGAFVMKLSPDFERIEFATVIGGRVSSGAVAIESAADGSLFLAGNTLGGGENLFPTTAGAFQTQPPGERAQWGSGGILGGPAAGFVARLSADGSQLLASTFVSGSVSDTIDGLKLDAQGSVIVHGKSQSQDFPATGPFRTQCGPDRGRAFEATFLTRLDAELSSVERSVLTAGTQSNGIPNGSRGKDIFLVLDRGLATIDLDREKSSDVACVVSGASYRKWNFFVPGQLLSLFGSNIGPDELKVFETGQELPESVDGIEVRINGVAAPILAGLSSQLNVVAPSALGNVDSGIEVFRNGERVFQKPLSRIESYAEAMLRISADGKAIRSPENEFSFLADVENEDGSKNGPDHPALPGSLVTLYATGMGELDSPIRDSGYGDGRARPKVAFAIDTPFARLTEIEALSAPGRTRAVIALRFRIPETSGERLPIAIVPASSPAVSSVQGYPNFLYVREAAANAPQ